MGYVFICFLFLFEPHMNLIIFTFIVVTVCCLPDDLLLLLGCCLVYRYPTLFYSYIDYNLEVRSVFSPSACSNLSCFVNGHVTCIVMLILLRSWWLFTILQILIPKLFKFKSDECIGYGIVILYSEWNSGRTKVSNLATLV